MKMLMFIYIIMLIFATVAIAYRVGTEGEWVVIPTNNTTAPFWTPNSSWQSCDYMDEGESCIMEWVVHASGFGSYQLKVNVTSSDAAVNSTADNITVTIYHKGNNSNVIPTADCVGCSFYTNQSNPIQLPFMDAGSSNITEWNITAKGPINSEWTIFARFDYNSTTSPKQTENITVRMVKYKWRDITGYINESWNCRKMINVTSNVSNNGIVEVREFEPANASLSNDACRIMNCSKEFRVSEILTNGSHQHIPYEPFGTNPDHLYYSCRRATVKFNTSLTANEAKSFFVYYNNPLIEIDYSSPNGSTIFNDSYNNINKSDFEKVWYGFFNSHADFVWEDINNTANERLGANKTTTSLRQKQFGYKPQTQVNRLHNDFMNRITDDVVYWFWGHGGIVNQTQGYANQTFFAINTAYSPPYRVLSDNITNLNRNSSAKFVMIIACFSGDNSTTKTCLTNWLSEAFKNKGADCYLGFFGRGVNDNPNCCNSGDCSDLYGEVKYFNNCFWGNITIGKTIKDAKNFADVCARDAQGNSQTNPILINSTIGGCDAYLNTTVV